MTDQPRSIDTVAKYTALSIPSAVPINAVTVAGWIGISASASSSTLASEVTGSASAIGHSLLQANGSTNINGPFVDIPLITPQTIYYAMSATGTVTLTGISVTGYAF
jgi:hypothetical protein